MIPASALIGSEMHLDTSFYDHGHKIHYIKIITQYFIYFKTFSFKFTVSIDSKTCKSTM